MGIQHPDLGPLFDCTHVYETNLYKFATGIKCAHKMHLSKAEVTYFTGDVRQFSPKKSSLMIYHCTAYRMKLTCHESFFGRKSKHSRLSSLHVSPTVCRDAMRTKKSPYGSLARHGNLWRTTTHDRYHCKWMRTKSREYLHFQLTSYDAAIVGNDNIVHQHVTHTQCHYHRFSYTPREMPKSQIVWPQIKHDSRLYHSLGGHTVHQLDNYLLVPSLSLAGGITYEDKQKSSFLLDNGYIIIKILPNYSPYKKIHDLLQQAKVPPKGWHTQHSKADLQLVLR